MPLIIPKTLPAYDALYNENIFVMHRERALAQHIRPLEILILNLMPTKITTETQIARLLANTPLQVHMTLLQTASHAATHVSAAHLESFYKNFNEVKNNRYDGMIITGAPVETMDFEQVDYWPELCEIMDFSETNVYSTLHVCWGAQAGLYYHYGVRKHILPEKIAVCGFSAGGHLALSGAVLDIPGEAAQPRPNAVILGYPVVTAGQYAHRGSFVQLAGSADPAAQQVFGLEDKITPQTPPVFVWTTMEDATVPVENTLMLVNALHRAGVPCEAHLFEKGVHGTSISTAEVDQPSRHRHHWVELAVEWLEDTFAFSVC